MTDITWPAPPPKPEPSVHPATRRNQLLAIREAEAYRGRPLIVCVETDRRGR